MLLYFYRVFIFLDQTRGPILGHECGPSWSPPQQGTTSWTALQAATNRDSRSSLSPRPSTRSTSLHNSSPLPACQPPAPYFPSRELLPQSKKISHQLNCFFPLSYKNRNESFRGVGGFIFSEGGISWI